jgi:ADP-ribosyl-[dinitrogen reductase] hydrolase
VSDRPASSPGPDDVEGTARRDRAIGALLGLACGDAVGTTLEFKRPGSFTPIDDMVGGGPFGLRPGEWTDDTSMALCLAESILDCGGLDPVDQLRRYVLWRDEGYLSSNGRCFDIGTTVSSQLSRFQRTGEAFDPRPDHEAAANGSLMPSAPVPIRWWRDPAEAADRAAESSRTTHPADRPRDACRVLGAMTAALIHGTDADAVLDPDFWQFGALHPAIEAVARGSWRGKRPPQVRGTGYCVDALEAAIWAVGGAVDFRHAVLRAANLGDDADTTAAIAGQLAGARWGASGIPDGWRERVVLADRIVAMASGLFDAASPTEGASQGAAPPPGTPWPHDAFLHAWWVEPGSVLAGEYPGDPEPDLASDKVNLLVDHGVRTFVDLTTPADPLEPYAEHVAGAASARALDLRWRPFPIRDFDVATQDEYDAIVEVIRTEQGRGAVYVHCWGGVGRTGTVIGCLLADRGLGSDATLARLKDLRAGTRKADRPSPETPTQIEVIRRRAPAAPS